MKALEDHFYDWESEVFGYGYGTGEPHIIPFIKVFLSAHDANGIYNYRRLESALTPSVAWLLINALCRADILECGTSPRNTWLTEQGKALKAFIDCYSDDQLLDLLSRNDNYVGCYPDYCNCDEAICHNPFWVEHPDRQSSYIDELVRRRND